MENLTVAIEDLVIDLFTEGFIIVAFCFIIGRIIKSSKLSFFQKIDNNYIPIITLVIGIIMSFIPDIFPQDGVIMGVIKGAISGYASTGLYEFYKKLKTIAAKKQ